jgi:RimJ/RimL family protein N-acetyltransferase
MHLILHTPDLAEALARGEADRLPAGTNIGPVEALTRGMAAAHRHLYKITGADAPWLGYLAVDETAGQIVGACAFKGPVQDGRVEINFMTFPPFQGQGHAVAMARALIDIARAHPDVREVAAHTPTSDGASSRILARLGFRRDDDIKGSDSAQRASRWLLACQGGA